jgi:alpha-1,3-glucan synthase
VRLEVGLYTLLSLVLDRFAPHSTICRRTTYVWPQMLAATSFQITLLSGQNWQDDLQLYVLGGVFLAASGVWYAMFRLKPSVYVLSAPWMFFGVAFFLIGLPSISTVIHPYHAILSNMATWCYAVASAAAFLFFGLNFGEEAVRLVA